MLPHHALQLCFYAAGIARVQERWPDVGARASSARASASRSACTRSATMPATREGRHAARRGARAPTEPIRCDHCPFCEFRPVCERALGGGRSPDARGRDAPRPGAAARGGGRDDADAARELPPGVLRAGSAAGRARRIDTAGAPPAARPVEGERAAATSCCRAEEGRGFALLPRAVRGRRHVRLRGRSVLDAGARA